MALPKANVAVGSAASDVEVSSFKATHGVAGSAYVPLVALFLTVLLPVFVVSSGIAFHWSTVVLMHALVMELAAVRLTGVVAAGKPRILSLTFWTYTYLWLGLAAFAQTGSRVFPLPHSSSDDVMASASLIVIVGVVAYDLGANGWRASSSRRTNHGSKKRVSGDISWPTVHFLAAVSLSAAVLLIPRLGGVSTFLTSRQALDEAAALLQSDSTQHSVQAIYTALLEVPPLLGLLFWLHVNRGNGIRRPRTAWVSLIVLISVNLVVNNPISQPRSWIAVCIFSVLFGSRRLAVGDKRFRRLAILFLLATIIVFPFASFFRYTVRATVIDGSVVSQQYTQSGDYDSYQQIEVGVEYVQRYGNTFGSRSLGPLFFWLPRSFWPGKPGDTGVLLARYAGYGYTNLSSPLWIEAYIEGGLAGTACVFFGLGRFTRRLEDLYDQTTAENGGVVRVLVPVIGFYQIAVLRGSLLTVTGRLVLLVAIPLALSWKARSCQSRLEKSAMSGLLK